MPNSLLSFNQKRDLMFEMFNQDSGMPFAFFDFSQKPPLGLLNFLVKPAFGLLNFLAKPALDGFSGFGNDLFDLSEGFLIHSGASISATLGDRSDEFNGLALQSVVCR